MIEIPNNLAREGLDAMLMRARWYVVRGCDIPEMLTLAIAFFSGRLKLDPVELLRVEVHKHRHTRS